MRKALLTTAIATLLATAAAPAAAQSVAGDGSSGTGGRTGAQSAAGGASAPDPADGGASGGASYATLQQIEAERRAAERRAQARKRAAAKRRALARKRAAAAKRRALARKQARQRARAQARRRAARRRAKAKPAPAPVPAPAPTSDHVFPVAGPFSLGGKESRFGAGRPGHVHQGQDIAAASGTPIVAPWPGTVRAVRFQAAGAGYYVVIAGDGEDRDYVFMHLLKGSTTVAVGDRVAKGQQFAAVGNSGSSSGPHLHFEIWEGGWYVKGGRPVDPLPFLQAWL